MKVSNSRVCGKTPCLVQVPNDHGSVTPETDSMRDDLPAFWLPMTVIIGKSMSVCTLSKARHEH